MGKRDVCLVELGNVASKIMEILKKNQPIFSCGKVELFIENPDLPFCRTSFAPCERKESITFIADNLLLRRSSSGKSGQEEGGMKVTSVSSLTGG